MGKELRILILEDSSTDAELIENQLHKEGFVFSSRVVDTREAFLKGLNEFLPALILSDYHLPYFDGLTALTVVQEKCPEVPFIFVTGVLGEENAIETIKKGASDYVLKDNLKRLVPVINRALKEAAELEKLKQMKSDLLSSEMRYRRLFETAKDGIILLNAETGQVEDINPFLTQMLGYSHEEILGKKLSEIDSFKNITETRRLSEELQAKEYIHCEHLMLEARDGKQIDVEFVSNVYTVDHQRIIQCNVRDITKRKRAEEALRESEERFKLIAESITEVFWMADVPIEKMLYISPGYECIWKRTRKSLYQNPRSFIDAIHPEDREQVLANLEVQKDGKPFDHEYRIVWPDGTIRWIWDRGFPVSDMIGRVTRYVGVAQDITERKLAEEALQRNHDDLERKVKERTLELLTLNDQLNAEIEIRKRKEEELKKLSQELKCSNAELKDFAYIASHDLRKPLLSIESFAKLLAKRYKNKFDAKADEFIDYIADSANRLQLLIKDLLEYSQIETKERDFELTDYSVVVKEAMSNLKTAIDESNAQVTYNKLPTIMSDPQQMTSLFQNLIDNAIKFCRQKAPRVHISAKRKGDEWIFTIRDNGIGIDPKDSERIFGMFQRLHGSGDYPGTGIGLSICKKIVERHRGRISVESETGKGTTFCFAIPERDISRGRKNTYNGCKEKTLMNNK